MMEKGGDMHKILLLGAGPMAAEYSKVLKALDVPFDTIGRGEVSAANFTRETNMPVITGGFQNYIESGQAIPDKAIVAVSEKQLGITTLNLLQRDVRSILVEKPGGFDLEEITAVAEECERKEAQVYVAYNRRFYASVRKAWEIINDDGGVTSFSFEFTEWSHVIREIPKEEGVKAEWFLHNSTHVIDLAFFLGGKPRTMSCYKAGSLDWHPSGSIYAGAGISETGALFSYQANWEAPGRWGVEFLTKRHRLIFRPLEKLQVQNIGSVAIQELPMDDHLDTRFKPGLYQQIRAFVEKDTRNLITISEHLKNMDYYQMIRNG